MKEKEILQALQTATIAAVASSTLPLLPVKYIGRSFTIPGNMQWLETVFIPNNIIGQYWGNEKTYRGIYRLVLHWGLDDTGAYPPALVAASVASYFFKGRTFQNGTTAVKITDQPDLTGVIEQAPEMLFPVSIRYATFQP